MISMEFVNEQEVIQYIKDNEQRLFDELGQHEIKTMYTNDNTRINVMKDGKRLLRATIRFNGDKKISDICKDVIDLRLL